MELFNFPEYNQPIGKINNLINDIHKSSDKHFNGKVG